MTTELQHNIQQYYGGVGFHAQAVGTKAAAQELYEDLRSNDPKTVDAAISRVNKALRAPFDEQLGLNNELNDRIMERRKAVGGTVLPLAPIIVRAVANMAGDVRYLDRSWEAAYTVDNLENGLTAQLTDMYNLIEIRQVPAPNSPIIFSDYMGSSWTGIVPDYYSGGVQFPDDVMRLDPMSNINAIIAALRFANSTKENRVMFAAMLAGIVAANTATFITAFSGTIQHTFNVAREALFNRLATTTTPMGDMTPVVLYSNPLNKDAIEAAFRQTNAVGFGTIQAEWAVERRYTRNLAVDFGLGGAAKAVLVVPGDKNRQGVFKPLQIVNERQVLVQSTAFATWHHYTSTTNANQFQLFNLS